ncbi:hypothetical protein AN1V17_27760 [Vallitalea sediminicola]
MKIRSFVLLVLISVIICTTPIFACEIDDESFIIRSEEYQNCDTVVISKTLSTSNPAIKNEIVMEITKTKFNSTETVNFVLSGRYYLVSNDDTVSNYGIEGSADCTGDEVENVIYDVYHNVKPEHQDNYNSSAAKTKSTISDGVKLKGTYKLKNKKTGEWESDIAKITIIIKKDGNWETEGNYGDISIN